ncbi:MAG: OpgC domain-containing protein, partial [Verrucomicrobiota bacterium]|nr:OpgC domain-containing protein [Verrucomicrobiota bacterium]
MQALLSPAASVRDIRFDSLRGLMLLSMAINHLPSQLRSITDQSLGVFSSAEGFVFLSGLLAGYVYTRRLRRDGVSGLRTAVLRRARMIYVWHLLAYFGAFILLTLNVWISGAPSLTSPRLFSEHPWQAALLGPLLLYQPGLLDILPMYCVFVLLLPLVLGGLENGHRRWIILASFAAWVLAQFLPTYAGAAIISPLNFGFFNL